MEDATHEWYSDEAATFGDRVAGARDASGMSQEQLAKRLGIKLTTLQNWENDLAEPRANKLSMLSGVLGVSMRWLLSGEGEGVTAPDDVSSELPEDINDLLVELRAVKSHMAKQLDRVGVIEKRLRAALKNGA